MNKITASKVDVFTCRSNKVNIEDETPITQEEARTIRAENYSNNEKILELGEKISNMRTEHEKKLSEVASETEQKIRREVEEIKKWKEKNRPRYKKNTNDEDDRTKVLRFFYEKNYKTTDEASPAKICLDYERNHRHQVSDYILVR